LAAELPRFEVQLANVGHISGGGTSAGWPFIVAAAGQAREALLTQDLGNGHRTVRDPLACQGSADILHGQVLLA
jgi:hypothetical protein